MGEYRDMDRINMGSVYEINIEDIISQYASLIFESQRIDFNNEHSRRM